MNITPQELGPEGYEEILRTRALYPADTAMRVRPASVPLSVGRILAALVAATAAGALVHSPALTMVLLGVFVLVMLVIAFVGTERLPAQYQIPLTAYEVREVQQNVKDPLQRSFLELVVSAINTPPTQDADAEESVRDALRALGAGIAELVPLTAPEPNDDPAALAAEAARLSAEASAEADAVVASSLRRRAEALTRQAEIAARTATLLRRNDALRQEIAGQIAALRTSLAAFRIGGRQTAHELADVAASIQRVAIEAGAMTQARDEIAVALLGSSEALGGHER
ncbi:MAG: hypothetical protein JO250_03850 [Armatimonadetes bacterium]|nr:hypothetical protein [Armatimonadota bacterium]